ncbi:hypothetical protein F511_39425 [Dorcoceras hygrometricum]|uniref:Uncharacterized protein n=1 Tax=Dorcoceras hygrometricum TaxID=472368 RepID=A0A2Z7A8N4_9LAMI|nr:hypothetical protein F511_39425 [Dorcoceras hygrometricum]
MEHNGMVKMFKSLKDSGLKGFLEGSGSVYEEAVLEFFTNAKIVAGTIVSLVGARRIAITKDTLIEVFELPDQGINNFLTIPKEIALEMRRQFSGTDEPFKAPNKKRDMPIEFRLLHDIVAKDLCAKSGSFDQVTSEKLDLMGFAIQVSSLLQYIFKENLGESVKLHSRKVLTSEGNLDDEHLNPGSNKPEKKDSEHNVQMGNNNQLENQGCETQLDSVNPITKDSGAVQNEQLLNTATQSLTTLSTRVSYLDQAYACILNDTNMTRHHTILMRDQLKNEVDGLDIKIDVLERTLTQRMVDEMAVVKSQLAALTEGMQEFGAAKNVEGVQNRPREGSRSSGPSNVRGRELSIRGGRGFSSGGGRGPNQRSDDPADPNNRFRFTPWF